MRNATMMTIERVREILDEALGDFYGDDLSDSDPGITILTPDEGREQAGHALSSCNRVVPEDTRAATLACFLLKQWEGYRPNLVAICGDADDVRVTEAIVDLLMTF